LISEELLLHQACYYPIESLNKAEELLEQIRSLVSWDKVGLLADELFKNQVFMLISNDVAIASFRLNLLTSDLVLVISNIVSDDAIELRNFQGEFFDEEKLASLELLNGVWNNCISQATPIKLDKLSELLNRVEEKRFIKGRGKDFSKSTRDQVMFDSYGYCMFEGCGARLDLDKLTGYEGNYSYNAHIVASSEVGPRGIPYLSEQLSNDPNNVMLLCDKHHRLIDRIALANYNASRLSKMRTDFIESATKLLAGLSYQPLPVYSVLWPIGSYSSSYPASREISACLSRLKARIMGGRIDIGDNDRSLMRKPDRLVREMDEIVQDAADEILGQTRKYGYKAALFAFGPMPALVGLGAVLGNKNEITPMLRYRDGNCWVWPQENPVDKPYEILPEGKIEQAEEVVLSIALTNHPENMKQKAAELGFPHIKLVAKVFGNGAIPHPENGYKLKSDLHRLLQQLKDEHCITRVHLLICASNAACVFVGQAFDLYQPELVVYDFVNGGMEPRLTISTKQARVSLQKL
tara:strand:+ start:10077 stop:11642 length:1566 start_codon:yes stop_codon:yes gene_type:complete